MAKALGVFSGPAGRVALLHATQPLVDHAHPQVHVIFKISGDDTVYLVEGEAAAATDTQMVLVNPWVAHSNLRPADGSETILLALYIDAPWFAENCRAILRGYRNMPFPKTTGNVTPELRLLAADLARQVLDQDQDGRGIDASIDTLMHAVAAEACPDVLSAPRIHHRPFGADYRIRKAVQIIRAAPRKTIRIDAIASEVGLSRSHFHERFRECMGISPGLYIDSFCCDWAAQQLCERTQSVAAIARELGFSAQSHFTRFFKSKTGVAPRDFRRGHGSRTIL